MKDYVKTSYATDVVMRWTIVDGDTGEQFVCDMPGCSESPGDKGVYVSITGSEKYLLMKLFLLPTGDDPEDVSNEPAGSDKDAKAVGEAKVAKLREKASQKPSGAVPTMFYTRLENGSAELVNVKQYGESLNEVAAEGLRLTLKKYVMNVKGDLIVPADRFEGLEQELTDCKVPFKEVPRA